MKKILVILILLITSMEIVKANTISSIDMDIYVDIEGTATVTETWRANVSSGSEGYHPYFNLGNSKISLLEASIDNQQYTILDSWNENSNFENKAYKAGLYYPESNEVDICFGITSYGSHIYKVKYAISNFINTTEDSDIIYWTLFPSNFNVNPNNVTIKIYTDYDFSNTLDVWGYGKYGAPCYVHDGKIIMTSNGILQNSEYLTILVKFEKGTFKTLNNIGNNFEYYYNMAEEGTKKYEYSYNYNDNYSFNNKKNNTREIVNGIFRIVIIMALIGGYVFIFVKIYDKKNSLKKFDFYPAGNKIRKDAPIFRDIPCNGNIFRAYWVATNYNLTKKKEDFLGAIILKWLEEGNIKIEKRINKKNKEENVIILVKAPTETEQEKKLYEFMNEIKFNEIIEPGAFEDWCKRNGGKILNWFDRCIDIESNKLVQEGKAITTLDGIEEKHTVYHIYNFVMQDAEEMYGFKKFLKEFSVFNTREYKEVALWSKYLIYAQMFGMTKEVMKQLKDTYPSLIKEIQKYGIDDINIEFIHHLSSKGIHKAKLAMFRTSSNDKTDTNIGGYSSGGGGFSSDGGGSGSFGGGSSGGGGFR